MIRAAFLALALFALAACAPPHAPPLTSVVLHDTTGAPVPLDAALAAHPVTVITFFSATCPCQRTHDARLRDLIAKDTAAGAGFLVVDSEESATLASDAAEAHARGYAILLDDHGKLARAFDAEYATYSVVVDGKGAVLFRGGFDSDKTHLKEDRETYLADAVDDALAGRPMRRPEAKTLGCTLELH